MRLLWTEIAAQIIEVDMSEDYKKGVEDTINKIKGIISDSQLCKYCHTYYLECENCEMQELLEFLKEQNE